MAETAFKQVSDNALSFTATDLSATGVTSIALTSGTGSLFPEPGNGFYLTLWNSTLYSNPGADPNMEKVTCPARSTDTLTISATTKTHTSPCAVALLDVSQNTADLQTAVNSLENAVGVASGIAPLDSNSAVPVGNLPAATSSSYGIIKLTGDLGGTAASPTVPGLADKASAADLTTETARAEAAESTNATAITTEATTRASADTTLQNNITTEASTRATADTTNANAIATETTRAEAAEALKANTADLATVATSGAYADLSGLPTISAGLFTHIVAPSGGDYTTLSDCLADASAGDTIYIKPGTYSEAGGTFSQANLTIIGAGSETVVLTLGGNLTLSGNYSKLSGVTIDGDTSYATIVSGEYCEWSYNHIKGSNSTFFNSSGLFSGFVHNIFEATGSSARCLFGQRNRITGNHFTVPHLSAGGISFGHHTVFTGNFLIYQSLGYGSGGPLICITSGERCSITGNLFFCGDDAAIQMDFRTVFSGNSIYQGGGNAITVGDGDVVTGNAINMNYAGTAVFINATSGGTNATVVGNDINGNGTPLSSSTGISVNSGNKAIINGNSIVDVATGISIPSGVTSTIVNNNSLTGCTTEISDSGTNTIISNNAT